MSNNDDHNAEPIEINIELREKEAKNNMSEAQKGRIVSQRARQNMSESHKGKKLSLNTKQKQSESLRKYNKMQRDEENEIISRLFNGIFTK